MIKKYLLSALLITIIIIFVTLLIVYKDKAFTNKIEIDYPNGCKEVYVNAVLVGEPCEEKNEMNKWNNLNPNLTFPQ